jgi:hypothetical protein
VPLRFPGVLGPVLWVSVFTTIAVPVVALGQQTLDLDPPIREIVRGPQQPAATRARRFTTTVLPETTYLGYTPGHSGDNYWSVWSGQGLHRPPAQGGMWDFDGPYGDVHGDSLQGWWPVRRRNRATGALTVPDVQRLRMALDYGNMANYVLPGSARTFGVTGVWHVDGGNTVPVPLSVGADGKGGVTWAPLHDDLTVPGVGSAWMGLRRHGDESHVDATARGGTGNAYNENVIPYGNELPSAAGGSDRRMPGYASQMDQLLYRDLDLSGPADTILTIAFLYRTTLSTSVSTSAVTRTGWFQHDPLVATTGGGNPNYIASTGNPTPPADSFMVYVGAPAEGSVILSDGQSHSIFDPKRRWFGEVIRSNEGLYRQILSAGGTTTPEGVAFTRTLSASELAAIKAASGGVVRLVFRVKTNQVFDDETFGSAFYSSNGAGAALVDDVRATIGAGPTTTIGSFDTPAEIDARPAVGALQAWKSTGKPPHALGHTHPLGGRAGGYAPLRFEDLCGPLAGPISVCNLSNVVVSMGNHDLAETAGGPAGTAEEHPGEVFVSPTIQLAGAGATPNPMGLTADHLSDDWLLDYEIYTGVMQFFSGGAAGFWMASAVSYPSANSATGAGEHPRWGDFRFPGFLYTGSAAQCFRVLDPLSQVIRTTNASGIPDSIRLVLYRREESFRLTIPPSHDQLTAGGYWDNVSMAFLRHTDPLPLVSANNGRFQDTFPANADSTLPGNPAAFDTTSALIKSGINTYVSNSNRWNVPGDTVTVEADGPDVRVDLVFRVLPGPGNYVDPTALQSALKAVPTALAPIPAPAAGVSNFWANYLHDNGPKGTPGGHPIAASGPLAGQKVWSPHVWNSARLDSLDSNLFPIRNENVPVMFGSLFMTAYHESELADPHRGALAVPRNLCFYSSSADVHPRPPIICGAGPFPPGTTYPPAWALAPGAGLPPSCTSASCVTSEGTKVLPDGLLTPGSHVQYFFRREDSGLLSGMCPDTNQVTPQPCDRSEDGTRWHQFSVLPDRWKDATYVHPVLGRTEPHPARMLVVDADHGRGDERHWTGAADSICATREDKRGSHNGWSAPGEGDPNDPEHFVARNAGQAGTTWDLYNIAATNVGTIPSSAGAIGGRYAYTNPSDQQMFGKQSTQGPTLAMLKAYYQAITFLADDRYRFLGPEPSYDRPATDDVRLLTEYLESGNPTTPDRGLFAVGDDFVEQARYAATGPAFLTSMLGVTSPYYSYLGSSGNTELTPDLDFGGALASGDRFALLSACGRDWDVLATSAIGSDVEEAAYYDLDFYPGYPSIAGVHKRHSAAYPWIALTTGFSLKHVYSEDATSAVGRRLFLRNALRDVFGALDLLLPCALADVTPDAPAPLGLALRGNPLRSSTTLRFGLPRADRVKVQVYDIAGRLLRTLADRRFAAGEHEIVWDGADHTGRRLPGGVYFARVAHEATGYGIAKRVVVVR